MVEYEVIILGATFTAAGLLQGYTDKCLVLERRPQAGYEFINALNYGSDYHKELYSKEAKNLHKEFIEKKAFCGDRICLFEASALIYKLLEDKKVMLNMEIVSVEKKAEGFTVTAHGVSGYREFQAKKVIDTRVHSDMIAEKTINVLVNGEEGSAFSAPESMAFEKWGGEGDMVLKCPVPIEGNYIQARKAVAQMVQVLPDNYKILMIADTFGCKLKGAYPFEKGGILYMPSVAYDNPLLAFDAGVLFAQGGVK